MQEDLANKTSIQFPDVTIMSIDNMTAMIEIPTTTVLRALEGGTCICISLCIHMYVCICTYNNYSHYALILLERT